MQFPRWHSDKESACQCRRPRRHEFDAWVGKFPQRRKQQPTPVFLPGKFHGQRSLAGYSPWGHKGLETPEQIHTHTCSWIASFNILKMVILPKLIYTFNMTVWKSLLPSFQFSCSVLSDYLQPHGLQHTRLPVHHQLPELAQTHVQ